MAGTAAAQVSTASAAPPPRNGVVCTTGGDKAGEPVFDLTTRTGYIDLPDGNTAFMWGYSNGFDAFQHPGPVLCVHEGDTVTVILHNTLPDATSIVFPGQDDVHGQRGAVTAAGERHGDDDEPRPGRPPRTTER